MRNTDFIHDLISGDSDAWSEFYPFAERAMRATLRSEYKIPEEDVDDIIQRVFLSFIEDDYAVLRAFTPNALLTTFASMCARNKAYDLVNSTSRRHEVPVGGLGELDVILYGAGDEEYA